MVDFGFGLSKSSAIRLDQVDLTLYRKLEAAEPDVRICMSCSSTCTAGPWTGMSVRKVILALQRGEDVAPMLKGCMLCGKCTMVCPRGINTRHLLLSLCRLYEEKK